MSFCAQASSRSQHPLPHRIPVQVALLKQRIRPRSGMNRRVLAVLLHEDAGGAVYVKVGDHRFDGVLSS
jgi:hypothetical protein